MEGALDLTAMQQSVGEQGFGVSAHVAGRIELVAHPIKRDLDASDLHPHRHVVPQFAERSRCVPFLVHRHCRSSYAGKSSMARAQSFTRVPRASLALRGAQFFFWSSVSFLAKGP